MYLKHLISKSLGFIKRYKTVGFTAAAVVGVPATAVFAAKGYEKYKETERKREFIPAAIAGGITIGTIIACEVIHIRTENALILAHNLMAEDFSEYQSAVRKLFGAAGAAKVIEEVAAGKDRIDEIDIYEKEVDQTTDGEALHWFYDCYSGTWFKDTWYNVLMANLSLQEEYHSCGYGYCQFYYGKLDLPYDGPDSLGFSYETLSCDWDYYTGVPFTYDEVIKDGEVGIAIDWPIKPEVINWDE